MAIGMAGRAGRFGTIPGTFAALRRTALALGRALAYHGLAVLGGALAVP